MASHAGLRIPHIPLHSFVVDRKELEDVIINYVLIPKIKTLFHLHDLGFISYYKEKNFHLVILPRLFISASPTYGPIASSRPPPLHYFSIALDTWWLELERNYIIR